MLEVIDDIEKAFTANSVVYFTATWCQPCKLIKPQFARAGTIEALESNYNRTAVLKGLPPSRILARHILRNSLLPTIAVTAVQAGYLVGGLVVVETLFNYPGIGNLIYTSATQHDQPVLQASVFLVALIYTVGNLVADLLTAWLNPRVRLA